MALAELCYSCFLLYVLPVFISFYFWTNTYNVPYIFITSKVLKLFLRNKILNYYLAKISKIKKLRMVHMNLSCKAVLKRCV